MRPQRHGRILSLPLLFLPLAASQMLPALTEEEANDLIHDMQQMENNQTGPNHESELMDTVMGLVVGDAAKIRLYDTRPNTSEDCTWPTCTAYCVPCAKTNKYWTCLTSATVCQENSECVLGACFAEPGYCYADAFPQVARCFMGAVPEKPTFKNDVILRLGAAAPVPLPSADLEKWHEWAMSCLVMPGVFLLAAIWFAYKTLWVIECSVGDECEFLPERRTGIIVLTLICMALFALLQVMRFMSVAKEIDVIAERVAYLERSMQALEDMSQQLLEAERSYNRSLVTIPQTCGDSNPLAKHLVELLAGALQAQFAEVDAILLLVRESFTTTQKLLHKIQNIVRQTGWKLIYYPFIPSIVLVVGVVAILSTAFYIWNKPRLLYAPRMKCALKSFAPIIVIFMVTAGILGAGAFFFSLVVSGFCLHVDDNLVQARNM